MNDQQKEERDQRMKDTRQQAIKNTRLIFSFLLRNASDETVLLFISCTLTLMSASALIGLVGDTMPFPSLVVSGLIGFGWINLWLGRNRQLIGRQILKEQYQKIGQINRLNDIPWTKPGSRDHLDAIFVYTNQEAERTYRLGSHFKNVGRWALSSAQIILMIVGAGVALVSFGETISRLIADHGKDTIALADQRMEIMMGGARQGMEYIMAYAGFRVLLSLPKRSTLEVVHQEPQQDQVLVSPQNDTDGTKEMGVISSNNLQGQSENIHSGSVGEPLQVVLVRLKGHDKGSQ